MRKIGSIRLNTLFCAITLLLPAHASFKAEHQELFHACKTGRINVLKYLLEIGTHAKTTDRAEEAAPLSRALFIAVSNRHLDGVQHLINAGADVNKPHGTDQMTPLHAAVQNKDHELVQLLIQAGANVNAANAHQETPLYIASKKGDIAVVKCLIQAQPDLNTIHAEATPPSRTPLCIALISSNFTVAEILLQAGADHVINRHNHTDFNGVSWDDVFRNAAAFGSLTIVQWLARAGIHIDTSDKLGNTALARALDHNRSHVVKYLIEAGADIDAPGIKKEKLLHVALTEGLCNLMQCLIRSGINVNKPNHKGETPLWIALKSRQFDVAELLIDAGANSDAKEQQSKKSLLYKASEDGRLDVAQWLIRKHAVLDASNNKAITPLWIASHYGHFDVVQLLIHSGSHVNHAIHGGATPLYQASGRGHFAIVQLLIQAGANIHQKKVDGSTCLQIAARKGHLNIVRYLHYLGADIDAAYYPKSAFRFAVENKKVMVARFLICKGAKITQSDLKVAGRNGCFIHILAGVIDFIRAHPAELQKYRTAMFVIVENYYKHAPLYRKNTEEFKLTAALCVLLFSYDLKKTSPFVATGKQQLRHFKWLRKSLSEEKRLAPVIVDHILTNFLSMPKVI